MRHHAKFHQNRSNGCQDGGRRHLHFHKFEILMACPHQANGCKDMAI